MKTDRLLAIVAAMSLLAAACQAGSSAAPSVEPSGAPSTEPTALTSPPPAGPALAGKRLCISSIVQIQVLDIFYDDMKSAALNSGLGLEIQVKNQNGDIAKQIEDIDQFVASGECAAVATVTSVDANTATGWEKSASDAKAKNIGFFNFSSDYITGAVENVSNPHYDPGFQLGVQAANWYQANGSTGTVGTLSNVASPGLALRTKGFVDGFHSVVPGAQVFDAGSGNGAVDGAAAGSSLLQAHPDITVLFAWGADVPLGAIQASTEAGKTDPTKFSVWGIDVSDAQIADIIGGKSILQGGGTVPFRFCAPAWERAVEWWLLGQSVPPAASCIPFVVTKDNGNAYLRASVNQFLPDNAPFFDQSMVYFKDPVKTGDPFPVASTGFAWKGATTVPKAGVTMTFP